MAKIFNSISIRKKTMAIRAFFSLIGQYTLIFILWNYSFNWNHDLQERLEGRPYFSICLYDKQNYIYKQSMFLSGH
jgi:hypothetical protein